MTKAAERKQGGKWCILRTSAARTLLLTRSLADAGIGAWSPKKVIDRRRGASRARYQVEVPIIPTFVFVPAAFCDDIRRIIALPNSPHPQFSLFTYHDAVPLIFDSELTTIRFEEERANVKEKKQKRYQFDKGDAVHTEQAAFLGMTGVVESCDGKRAWVRFGGNLVVNVGAWQLLSDAVRAA